MSNIFDTLIEVDILNEENFLKIKETLTRIGISSRKSKSLFQTCHILHKQGRYFIVHFLEMFIIDGKGRNFTDEDRARRNTIAQLLEEWGLVKILNRDICNEPVAPMKLIRIIPYKEKNEWELVEKYSMGNK